MSSSLWNCAVCTMENSMARTICEACRSPRPANVIPTTQSTVQSNQSTNQPSIQSINQSSSQSTQSNALWSCPTCTFQNENRTMKCQICDAQRPAQAFDVPMITPPIPARTQPLAIPKPASKSNNQSLSSPPGRKLSSPKVALAKEDIRYCQHHPEEVDFLTAMGFPTALAITALRASDSNKEMALDHLMSSGVTETVIATPPSQSSVPKQQSRNSANLSVPTTAKTTAKRDSPAASATPSSASPSQSSASSLSRSVPNTTSVPVFQPVGPTPRDLERQRREEEDKKKAAAKREVERNRLLAELKIQEDDLKLKEKEGRLAEIAALNAKKAEEERLRKLAAIKKARDLDERRQRELAERQQHLAAKIDREVTLEQALKDYQQQYETHRVHETLHMLLRILKNALTKGEQDPKYLSLSLSIDKVARVIVRPVFGLLALNKLGWHETNGTLTVILNAQNKQAMQSALTLFENQVAEITTVLPEFFSTIREKYSAEMVYFLALELQATFVNVLSSPEERNFRSIDLESDTYKLLFQPIPEVEAVLDAFGFTVHASNVYRIVETPDVRLFEAGVIDVNTVIASLRPHTPIVQALNNLFSSNRPKLVKAFYDQFIIILNNIVNDPHEQKYHRVRVDRVLAKLGASEMVGAVDFFSLFGFELSEDRTTATLPYPGYSLELFRLRTRELERAWKHEIETRRAARDAKARAAEQAKIASYNQSSSSSSSSNSQQAVNMDTD